MADDDGINAEARLEEAWLTSPRALRAEYLAAAWQCADADQRFEFLLRFEDELADCVPLSEEGKARLAAEEAAPTLSWHDSRDWTRLARRVNQLAIDVPAAAAACEGLLCALGLPKSLRRGVAPGDRPPEGGFARYRDPNEPRGRRRKAG
jgi:hypothetical protein